MGHCCGRGNDVVPRGPLITRDGAAYSHSMNDEQLLKRFVDCMSEYAVAVLDVRGNVVYWNRGAAKITGFAAHEMLGRPMDRVFATEEVDACVPARELVQAAEGR